MSSKFIIEIIEVKSKMGEVDLIIIVSRTAVIHIAILLSIISSQFLIVVLTTTETTLADNYIILCINIYI